MFLPSRLALWALLALPTMGWLAAVGSGIVLREARPEGAAKHVVEELLIEFDRLVFRTYGALLPFAPFVVRYSAMAIAAAATGNKALCMPAPRTAAGRVAGPTTGASTGVRPTLLHSSLLVYMAVAVLRAAIYMGHLYLQRRSSLFLASDHVLLAAAVLACLQSEMVMCLSDIIKCEVWVGAQPDMARVPPPLRRRVLLTSYLASAAEFATVAVMVMTMLLYVVISADMHLTARFYHSAPESWAALAGGLAMFQLPVAAWILHTHASSSGSQQ